MTKKNGKSAPVPATETEDQAPEVEVESEVVMVPLDKEKSDRIQSLISGDTPAPNKFVAYLLRKIRTSRKEFEDIQIRIRQGRAFLSSLEKKSLILQGEHNKYLEDIAAWDRELLPSDAAVPEPEVPVPPAVGPDGKPTSAEA